MVKRVTGRWSGIRGWYQRRQRRARILLVVLPLVVLIGLSWWGVRDIALRSADHMTVTITRLSADDGGPAGGVVWRHTFGQQQAAQAQDLLNNHTVAHGPFSRQYDKVPIPGGHWSYQMAFTWHGILIETATVRLDAMPESYTLSSLGIPDLASHWTTRATNFSLLASITPENGVSIPLPPGYNPQFTWNT